MNYKIKVNRVQKENSNIKGFTNVVFGENFKITNIAILDGKNTYRNFCNPITKEFREELYGNILKTYESTEFDEMYVGYNQGEIPDKLEYEINVVTFEKDGSSIKGLARVFFNGEFIVNNVSILSSKDTEFVSMPSYRTNQMDKDGRAIYQDVCYPVTKEFREELYGNILRQYKETKNKDVIEKEPETKKCGKKAESKSAKKTKKDEEKEGLTDTSLKR